MGSIEVSLTIAVLIEISKGQKNISEAIQEHNRQLSIFLKCKTVLCTDLSVRESGTDF